MGRNPPPIAPPHQHTHTHTRTSSSAEEVLQQMGSRCSRPTLNHSARDCLEVESVERARVLGSRVQRV